MASDKVKMILTSKGAPFTEAELGEMSDAEGWAWIYSQRKPKEPRGPEVCFTGFGPELKKALSALAEHSGLHVAKTVTKGLSILCAGPNAGPAKVAKAEANGARILTEEEFRRVCEQDRQRSDATDGP